MLYENDTDSIPYKERPSYFAKTNKQGFFDLAYLPNGQFKLVTIKDENANYLFDPQSEKIGFIDNLVSPSDTLEYFIHVFKEVYSNQYIKTVSSDEYGKVTFIFNEPTTNPTVNLIGQSFKKQWYIEDLNETKDTLIYWITETVDTLLFEVLDEETIIDTVDIIMRQKPKEKNWAEKKLRVSINAKKAGEIELYNSLSFIGQHPIMGYDEKSILLIENEQDTVAVKLKSNDFALRRYYFEYEWEEAATYSLTIFPGTFWDIYGLQNDTIRATFKTPTWNKYADVNLAVELPENCKSGIVQLLSAQKLVLQENSLSKNETINYKHLKPGKYSLKMIYDENQNGKWDTGSLLDKRQPEKVIYYSGVVEVRSGWDIDLTWKIED
ncbi:MAG: hypothetical protein JKY53_05155 [Flavobacteriales bacterium]|nr:hypothetical protein [Flavobacteriales bacterium]